MIKVLTKIVDYQRHDSLSTRMRSKRMELFLELLMQIKTPLEEIKIADIGGSYQFWASNLPSVAKSAQITIINRGKEIGEEHPSNISYISGDARNLLMIQDQQFDIAFSNSVIEHVGTLYDQIKMAQEVTRIARSHFIQTPNRRFPLEPHFLVPLWQYLPFSVKSHILSSMKVGWHPRQKSLLMARAEVEQIRLLSKYEIQQIFPSSEVHEERIGPFCKSFMAIKYSA